MTETTAPKAPSKLPALKRTVLIGWAISNPRPRNNGRANMCTLEIELRPHDNRAEGPSYELSICSTVWNGSGNDQEAGGQYREIGDDVKKWAPGWDAERLAAIVAIWDRWHLNGMRAGCEHQRTIDTQRKVEVVSYKLTSEAYYTRKRVLETCAAAALRGDTVKLTPQQRALGQLDNWFQSIYTAPDADAPLSGCYEVDKREQKAIGWTYPTEHPEGMLTKACEMCGYQYGSSWLFEELPADVLATIKTLIAEGE